jgi:hypothetical protein
MNNVQTYQIPFTTSATTVLPLGIKDAYNRTADFVKQLLALAIGLL